MLLLLAGTVVTAAVAASCRVGATAMLVFFLVSDTLLRSSIRLEIQEILRGFLCTVISLTPEDLVPCVYLACNEVSSRSNPGRIMTLSRLERIPLFC